MANLLQTIQQNRQTLAQPQGVPDQTQKISTLLKAKSGKAGDALGSDTGISNLGEQSAVANTNQQLAQGAQQAAIQGQQEQTAAAGTQQQEAQQRQAVAQSRQMDTLQTRVQTQSILQNLAQNKGDLSDQEKQAQLEQVAFNLSMQDKKYTDQLQDIGTRRRLDNQVNFNNEMQQIAFGDSLDIMNQKLGENDVLTASDQDFQKALNSLSIQDAMKIASVEMAGAQSSQDVQNSINANAANIAQTQANTQAMYGGLGGAVSGGINAYGNANKPAAKTPAPTEGDT